MNVESKHLIMDIWFDEEVEPVVDKICNIVDENFTVVHKTGHLFSPQGRTIVFILSESHFTIHTYPEHNYITLDIYICNPNYDLKRVRNLILACGKVKTHEWDIYDRGIHV